MNTYKIELTEDQIDQIRIALKYTMDQYKKPLMRLCFKDYQNIESNEMKTLMVYFEQVQKTLFNY